MNEDHPTAPPLPPSTALRQLWQAAGLEPAALERASLGGAEPVLPSSFAVGTAAQASMAAAALAATEVGRLRNGLAQQVAVDMQHAALACCSYLRIDGTAPPLWDKLSGPYRCADGWVRLHANFAHHRDAALRLLGLPEGPATGRADVERALAGWAGVDFESAAADGAAVAAALRSFADWDRHAQAAAVSRQPLLRIEPIADAAPRRLPALATAALPLRGLRVLDLTRILAGPVGTRALAACGADVLMVNAPHLPNIDAIADTSRGKLSALADLRRADDRAAFEAVVREADVLVQGYRPGALAGLGYGPEALARLRPGMVLVSLSAYGPEGPWAGRRGFDSLVQAATGFNVAEAQAGGGAEPRALPIQILDHASGHLVALGALAGWLRQQHEGGSWHVQVSLARTGLWLRRLGRVAGGLAAPSPDVAPVVETLASGFGDLQTVRHAVHLSATPTTWPRPSMPPGSHPLAWPAR